MILEPELVRAVKAGRKTMTREPANGDCRYKRGNVYAVQPGSSKTATAHVTVIAVSEQLLGEITLRDARREGFRTTDDFKAYWKGLYDSYVPEQRVWVILFTLGDQTDKPHLLKARPGGAEGDYTTVPARAMRDAGEEVSGSTQAGYAGSGWANHQSDLADRCARAIEAVGTARLEAARQNVGTPLARKHLKSAEHHLRAIQSEQRRSA